MLLEVCYGNFAQNISKCNACTKRIYAKPYGIKKPEHIFSKIKGLKKYSKSNKIFLYQTTTAFSLLYFTIFIIYIFSKTQR